VAAVPHATEAELAHDLEGLLPTMTAFGMSLHRHGLAPVEWLSLSGFSNWVATHFSPTTIPVSGVWPVPGFTTARGELVTGDGWCHSVAVLPADKWPEECGVDELAHLLRIDGVPFLSVKVSFGLLERHSAAARMQGNAQSASLSRREAASVGRLTDGAEDEMEVAALTAWRDVRHGAAGVQVALKLMVSAPDKAGLDIARDALRFAAGESFMWADGDQARHVLSMLPVGGDLKEVR
jgi:hypothetical protein